MSYQYDRYLAQHKSNVEAGFRWLQKNLPEITEGSGAEHNIVFAHDQSKTEPLIMIVCVARRSFSMNRNRFIQGLKGDIQFSEKERWRIIRRSLQKHSWKTKCTVAMEEFAELQQQISKQIRGYDDRIGLLEEMADAYICLNFLESIFDIKPDDLQKAIDVKLERERRNCQ